MAPLDRWDGRRLLGLGIGNQHAKAHGFMCDRELEHAVEDQAPAARRPSVEPEDELVEVTLEVRLGDRSLVGAEHPALGEGRHPVNAREQGAGVLPAGRRGSLAVRLVDVAEPVDAAVARPAIGDHPQAGQDVRLTRMPPTLDLFHSS